MNNEQKMTYLGLYLLAVWGANLLVHQAWGGTMLGVPDTTLPYPFRTFYDYFVVLMFVLARMGLAVPIFLLFQEARKTKNTPALFLGSLLTTLALIFVVLSDY